MILLLVILSLCLCRIQYMAAKKNIGAPWNGYGAIAGTRSRTSDAPMVYRVLLPWILGNNPTIGKYELCQTILLFLSMWSLYTAWTSFTVVLMAAVLFTATFWYDYWDWTLEIIGYSLALVSFPLSMLAVVPFSLSRETAPLMGVVYALHSGDYSGGAILSLSAVAILLFVRMVQGKHKLYCERWMLRTNLQLLKSGNVGAWIAVCLCAVGVCGAWGRPEFLFLPVVIGSGWLMAKADETRVFVACVPYAAVFLTRIFHV